MVALLPEMAEWSNMEFPHLTLVYAGSKEEISLAQFNQMAKDAASLAMISRPLGLRVLGVDIFGEPLERVKVLRLQATPELMAMRRFVESWNASEHQFRPHVTI